MLALSEYSLQTSLLFLQDIFDRAIGPTVLFLGDIDAFLDDQGKSTIHNEFCELIQKSTINSRLVTGFPLIIIATSTSTLDDSKDLKSCFQYYFRINTPNQQERSLILAECLKNKPCAPEITINKLSLETASFSVGDLFSLVESTSINAISRLQYVCKTQNVSHDDLVRSGINLIDKDFSSALEQIRRKIGDSIGAPKIPNVSWDDIGGLASVKEDIFDVVQLPLSRPDLFATGMKKRSGILLFGPPGTGIFL